MIPRTRLILFLSLLVARTAFAEMVFEKTVVEIDVKPGENEVIASFPFEIKGEEETIVGSEVFCTCVGKPRVEPLNPDRSAKLNWKVGEKGVIKLKMETAQFLGTVEKGAALKLLGRAEPITLMIRVNIPELIRVEPTNLKWDLGGAADEKVAKITIKHDQPIKILEHVGRNTEIFPYRLVTSREGWEYEVRVTPSSTAKAGLGMISLRTDSEHPRFKRAAVYATVRRDLTR